LGGAAMMESQQTYNSFLLWMRQIGRDCGVRDSVLLSCCIYSQIRWGPDARTEMVWLNSLMAALPLMTTHALRISVDQDDVTVMCARLERHRQGRASTVITAQEVKAAAAEAVECRLCLTHEPRLRHVQFPVRPHQNCHHMVRQRRHETSGVCRTCTARKSVTRVAKFKMDMVRPPLPGDQSARDSFLF
jgi:hypothetical protein